MIIKIFGYRSNPGKQLNLIDKYQSVIFACQSVFKEIIPDTIIIYFIKKLSMLNIFKIQMNFVVIGNLVENAGQKI